MPKHGNAAPVARRTEIRAFIRILNSGNANDRDQNDKEPAPNDQSHASGAAHVPPKEEQHEDVHRECHRPKSGRDVAGVLERPLYAAKAPAYDDAVFEPLKVHHGRDSLEVIRN